MLLFLKFGLPNMLGHVHILAYVLNYFRTTCGKTSSGEFG